MRKIALVAVLTLGAFGLMGGAASAHDASVSSDCDGYTVSFTGFSDGAHSATVNGQSVSWSGASHSASFAHPVNEGDPDYAIDVSWTDDGGGSTSGVQSSVGCEPTTTTSTTTTTTVPDLLDVCRDGEVIEIPADELRDGDIIVDADFDISECLPGPTPEPPIIVLGPATAIVRVPVFTG